jgi:hypothetical protein
VYIPLKMNRRFGRTIIRIVGSGGQTGSTRHVGHFCPIVLVPVDCEDGEFGGMKISRGNQSTRGKPAPAPLCPPQNRFKGFLDFSFILYFGRIF